MLKNTWRQLRHNWHLTLRDVYRRARQNPSMATGWLISTACLVIGLSLFVGTGPEIQTYLYALIRSDSPSIYGSAYQEGLARFPSLRQWLMAGLQPQFLLISTFIVAFSFNRKGARSTFVATALSAFLALIVTDLAFAAHYSTLSFDYALENVIADAFGSLVIAFLFAIVLIAANTCFVQLRAPLFFRGLAAGFVAVLLGIVMSAAAYYTTEFFYRPIPVRLDAVLDAPVNGSIGLDIPAHKKDSANSKEQTVDGPFRLLPRDIEDGSLRWNSPADDHKFVVGWNRLADLTSFDATIEFFADCFSEAINKATSVEDHQIKIRDIRQLDVSFDQGAVEFGTLDRAKTSGKMITRIGKISVFSIDLDPGSKKAKTTQFVSEDSSITVKSDGGDLGYYLSAPLFKAVGADSGASSRSMSIKANGNTSVIEIAKPRAQRKIGELKCRSVELSEAMRRDRVAVGGAEAVFGAMISIKERSTLGYGQEKSSLHIDGGNGWISFLRNADQARSNDHLGHVEFLAFKGNIPAIDIDGSATTARSIDEYFAFGDFVGSFEESSKVRFAGGAKALWKNGQRANPTKWEKLSWEQRTAMMTVLFSLIASVIGYVTLQIRGDIDTNWRNRL
ncbi:hypothetical protein [Bradyrhizobium sp. USDA 4508]